MIRLIATSILLVAQAALAYIPPTQDLLASNAKEISSGTFDVKIKLDKLDDGASVEESFQLTLSLFKNTSKYFEINQTLTNEKEQSEQLRIKNLSVKSFNLNEQIEPAVFYSMLISQLAGESEVLISLDKMLGGKFKFKNELVSSEKIQMMNQYKNYLKAVSAGDKTLESPLHPSNRIEAERAQRIYFSNLYQKEDYVSIKRDHQKFFFVVEDQFASIMVDQVSRNLENLKFTTNAGVLEMQFDQFIPFHENLLFPGIIVVKGMDQKIYKLEVKSVTFTPDRYETYLKRHSGSSETQKISKPPFLL